jgi:hypothetical protein
MNRLVTLSRVRTFIKGLRDNVRAKRIIFSAGKRNDARRRAVKGYVAIIRPIGLREKVRLFFTKEHREYWLKGQL